MDEGDVRTVAESERQFVLLLGYFVHKYCDGQAELDHKGFLEYLNKNPQLERMDEEVTSYYRVVFNDPIIH